MRSLRDKIEERKWKKEETRRKKREAARMRRMASLGILSGTCVVLILFCFIMGYFFDDETESVPESSLDVTTEFVTETEKVDKEQVSEEVTTELETEKDVKQDQEEWSIPTYDGYSYVEINGNQPFFTAKEKQNTDSFETYSDLDSLGRCGVAFANICHEIQPTEERGEIGHVRPSGWHTVKYNDLIDGNYLYNRCHLIGYQLAGENANEKNLITGTRYLNVIGMLQFENQVDDYVDSHNNHVLYRVTPIFEDDNLVASGVLMEAWSVEDSGSGICFNVYCFNVQPSIGIDYSNGESWEDASVVAKDYHQISFEGSDSPSEEQIQNDTETQNTNDASDMSVWISATGSKYHSINNCGRMNPNTAVNVSEKDAIARGLTKCSKCW